MFNTASNLLTNSGLTADQINQLINVGDFVGLGPAFLAVEQQYGINALWGIAQMTQEVGWSGHSWIADNKKNLFGLNAYDADPEGDASVFPSYEQCVADWGRFLRANYLTPGGAYYVSATPAGVARHYASDPNYAAEIVSIMNIYLQRSQALGNTPAAPVSPAAPSAPSSNTHVVQKGENLSIIASRSGLTLGQLEALNPHAGHPAGNYNTIWPGDVIVVSGAAAQAPTAATQYYTVVSNDNLSTIATNHGISLAQIEQLNPQINNPNLIFPGQSIRVK